MRGKLWPVDQERQLRALVDEGKNVAQIATLMGKTRSSVRGKLFNLGLTLKEATDEKNSPVAVVAVVASSPKPGQASALDSAPPSALDPITPLDKADCAVLSSKKPSQLPLQPESQLQPGESRLAEVLPSVEEQLKVMNAAVKAMNQPGVGRSEAARLQKVIWGAKIYIDYYGKYLNYREIEKELEEARLELAKERARKAKQKS